MAEKWACWIDMRAACQFAASNCPKLNTVVGDVKAKGLIKWQKKQHCGQYVPTDFLGFHSQVFARLLICCCPCLFIYLRFYSYTVCGNTVKYSIYLYFYYFRLPTPEEKKAPMFLMEYGKVHSVYSWGPKQRHPEESGVKDLQQLQHAWVKCSVFWVYETPPPHLHILETSDLWRLKRLCVDGPISRRFNTVPESVQNVSTTWTIFQLKLNII